MVGHLVRLEGRRKVALEREYVMELPLAAARLTLPMDEKEKYITRLVRKGAKALSKAGVRRLLTAPDNPWWEELRQWGLVPVESEGLVQALAAPLALAALSRQGRTPERSSVALVGKRVNRAFFQAAMQLSTRVRSVAVVAPEGGEALAAELRAEYGIPVLTAAESADAQVTLCFSPGELRGGGEVLGLCGLRPQLGGLILESEKQLPLPEEERLAFLTILWETGRLSPDDLRIRHGRNRLDRGAESTYNDVC